MQLFMSSRILSLFFSLFALTTFAQTPLPVDPAVRKGKLDNGLTYFIRHNNQTPGQADFYIAQRVGSILEQPHQRGLAHFLEHMAFNGTEHFPDGNGGTNSIRHWCEKNGIKFGADLNAYTSIESTVYNISNAPVARLGVADTCLLILHDWSHSLLLRDSEIDQERGVIREEWRTRRSSRAVQRLMEEATPTIYAGSKYADCLPIGSIEVVDTFHYESLRSYYKQWYRPDLQAIIVVGDVDVDRVEEQIKTLFANVPAPAPDAAERVYYTVPANDDMIFFIKGDDEQPTLNMSLFMKRDGGKREEKSTLESFRDDYLSRLAMFILRQRLAPLSKEAQPRVLSATCRDGAFYFTDACSAFTLNIGLLPDNPQVGIEAVLEVVEKARQYGFSPSELQHAKEQFNVNLEHRVDTKDKTRNGEYAKSIVAHFCDADKLMSIDDEADIEHALMESVTLDDVNAMVRQIIAQADASGANQVCILYGPTQWAGRPYTMPSASELKQWILNAESRQYANDFQAQPIDRTLIRKLPKKGKILSRSAADNGYTKYVLSNGINVYARASELEPNRLTINMSRPGGQSLYPDADNASLRYLASVVVNSGAADFDFLTLEKKRAGKALRVTPFIDAEEEGVRGVCAASDFKTWLEVMYLYLTQPRRDEAVFQNLMARQASILKNRTASPTVVFNDSLRLSLYGSSLRTAPMSVGRLQEVSLNRIYEIYNERFSNLAGMNLIITGDIRTDELEQLLCQYVASLPGNAKKSVSPAVGPYCLDVQNGEREVVFSTPLKTPSALTEIILKADEPYTSLNTIKLDILAQILRTIYTEKVREEQGGTYGVSVQAQSWRHPQDGASLTINFRCNPERYSQLLPIIYNQLELMAQHGPQPEYLERVKEYEQKNYNRVVLTNNYWEYIQRHQCLYGTDLDKDYMQLVNSITPEDIQQTCRSILSTRNRVQVTMLPQK